MLKENTGRLREKTQVKGIDVTTPVKSKVIARTPYPIPKLRECELQGNTGTKLETDPENPNYLRHGPRFCIASRALRGSGEYLLSPDDCRCRTLGESHVLVWVGLVLLVALVSRLNPAYAQGNGRVSKPISTVLREPLPLEELQLSESAAEWVIAGPTFTITCTNGETSTAKAPRADPSPSQANKFVSPR